MASGLMALGDAKSACDVDPTLRPDSRLAFRRPGCQMHGAHRTQCIIFADVVLNIIRHNSTLEQEHVLLAVGLFSVYV